MTDDDRLRNLLRSTLPKVASRGPVRDLWPSVVDRIASPMRPSWFDLGLAAIVAILLVVFPDWLLLLAYQL